jgi:DnaK suppressor protein
MQHVRSNTRGTRPGGRKAGEVAPKARLEADKRELEDLCTASEEEAGLHKPLAESTGGLVTIDSEDTDLAAAIAGRETTDILISLLDQNRVQVERALERVREGRYGVCEDCARPIPAERLRFQPASTRCVECQTTWDRLNGRTA